MMKTVVVHQFYCIGKSSDLRSVVHAVQLPARCRTLDGSSEGLVVVEQELKNVVPISGCGRLGPSVVDCPRSRSSWW